jgi:hypothetical protein
MYSVDFEVRKRGGEGVSLKTVYTRYICVQPTSPFHEIWTALMYIMFDTLLPLLRILNLETAAELAHTFLH